MSVAWWDQWTEKAEKAECENGDWTLDLSNNQIITLLDENGELKELVWLNLSNNKLTVILSHIKRLNKLWVLLLGDNQLTALPDDIAEVKF